MLRAQRAAYSPATAQASVSTSGRRERVTAVADEDRGDRPVGYPRTKSEARDAHVFRPGYAGFGAPRRVLAPARRRALHGRVRTAPRRHEGKRVLGVSFPVREHSPEIRTDVSPSPVRGWHPRVLTGRVRERGPGGEGPAGTRRTGPLPFACGLRARWAETAERRDNRCTVVPARRGLGAVGHSCIGPSGARSPTRSAAEGHARTRRRHCRGRRRSGG